MKKINFNTILTILLVGILAAYLGKYLYLKPKFINGEMAPDFSGQLVDGSDFQFNTLRGNFILLDFWGSWCGPCRVENPGLVQFYNRFKDQTFSNANGFKIVSIGIETSETRWKQAIEKDGLQWKYHLSELQNFESTIARLYGVREIPTKYLISPEGIIIGVNLSFEEMSRILEKYRS